ncbi:RNase H domain-containing protein [Trichonephila clavipes]|nr:RNase H domain-containing protein [Trichonephila clavipes]
MNSRIAVSIHIVDPAMLCRTWLEISYRHDMLRAEKLVVEVQSILYYLEDCDIHFSYVRGHSGNLGNERADLLAKEGTCRDMPFDVCAIVSLEALSLGKNCFLLEHRILGLA